MKAYFRALRNRTLRLRDSIFINYIYDATRFVRFSAMGRALERLRPSAARARMLRMMHSLEKGLALADPTPGFGRVKATKLVLEAAKYREIYGSDWTFHTSIAVLAEYQRFQSRHGIQVHDVSSFLVCAGMPEEKGGTVHVTRSAIQQASAIDFKAFTDARCSVRDFAPESVDESVILNAIDIARKAPSVCNRSSGRAYYSTDRSLIDQALSLQGGAKGLGGQVPGLLIVASDLGAFYSAKERNQPWIDGALFAMTLVYALHAAGCATCMLNWSKTLPADMELRKRFDIVGEHAIIMMVAVGHFPEKIRVAASPRQDVSTFALPLRVRTDG